MVSNGKYSNGGMLVNPFASVNDGLVDLTWVKDPSYMGMFGFREIVTDAKCNGGIQAYKDHSVYMRGRKIKATFFDPNAETPQPDPEAEGEETKRAPEEGDKYVGVDDNDLCYKRSVTWQSIPQNIEIMFDADSYFMEHTFFPEAIDRDEARERFIVDQIVDEMWEKYDVDNSGDLDKDEVRAMLKDISAAQGRPFKESAFDSTFA